MPNYEFTSEEVQAMYRLIMHIGWIPHNDDEIDKLVHRIMKIQKADDKNSCNLATSKTEP